MAKKRKIAIICSDEVRRMKIAKQIAEFEQYEYLGFDRVADLLNSKSYNKIDSVIFAVEQFYQEHIDVMAHLYDLLKKKPIVLVAKDLPIDSRVLFGLMSLDKCLLIEEKYELEDIKVLMQKLIGGESLKTRAHCRFPIDADVEINTKGRVCTAKALNLSMGGAQLKLPPKLPGFEPRQLLRLRFDGHKVIQARVTWLNREKKIIGVQFLKQQKSVA